MLDRFSGPRWGAILFLAFDAVVIVAFACVWLAVNR